jgi:hypothetical protein
VPVKRMGVMTMNDVRDIRPCSPQRSGGTRAGFVGGVGPQESGGVPPGPVDESGQGSGVGCRGGEADYGCDWRTGRRRQAGCQQAGSGRRAGLPGCPGRTAASGEVGHSPNGGRVGVPAARWRPPGRLRPPPRA